MDYIWLVYALLSAFTAALVAVFGKIGLEGIDTTLATALRAVVMAAFLIGVVLVQGKVHEVANLSGNSRAFVFIILAGIAGACSWLFYFLALKGAKVSQVVPIDRLSVVFALVLALLFLGERISMQAAIGAALMVVGGILVALS